MAKSKYANIKLEWAKGRLALMESYLDKNPYDEVEDRIVLKETKKGGVIPITAASIEQQQKNQRETLKEYLDMLSVVDKLDSDEGSGSDNLYAGAKMSPRMKNHGNKDEE